MGHERIGTLPRTKRWRDIVGQMAVSPQQGVGDVAARTLGQVRQRFVRIQEDAATRAAFKFLVSVAASARPAGGVSIGQIANTDAHVTPLKLALALRQQTAEVSTSPEYTNIAESAATDALAIWYDQHKPKQQGLFESFDTADDVWRQAGNGAGFCEMSRLFFAKFTERYLNYFLEREASQVFPSLLERQQFAVSMQTHLDDISEHAFETSKITQSYAAGWFNTYTTAGMPSEEEIDGFLRYAFGKMRDELMRGGG